MLNLWRAVSVPVPAPPAAPLAPPNVLLSLSTYVTGAGRAICGGLNVSSSNFSSPELFYRNTSLLRCPHAYEGFFGLQEDPFSLSPDPRYLYRTRHAHETLRQLTRGILARKGLILLSGEVGSGKTTLLNSAIQVLRDNPGARNKTRTAEIGRAHV